MEANIDSDQRIDLLIEKVRCGDREALGEVYELYAPKIHRFAYYRCGDRSLAEDLTQETFLQAFQALKRYEHCSADYFGRWLYGIARRVVADHYRRRGRAERAYARMIEPEPSDDSEMEQVADAVTIREAIKILTPEQREVVVLRFFGGLSSDEVAAKVKRKPGAVRALQFRALQRLREALA